jgi:hypothetical protein
MGDQVNDSWDSARRHPALALVGLFAAGLVGVALISYVGPGGGELYASVVTGVGSGLLLALIGWRAMRDGVDPVVRPLRPLTVFNVVTAGAGVALVAWGTISSDWPLALSGLPLLALAVGLILARRLLNRRTSTD